MKEESTTGKQVQDEIPADSSPDDMAQGGAAAVPEEHSQDRAAEEASPGKVAAADLFVSGSPEYAELNRLPDEEGATAPWLLTFADLMSLLLCFFILLFAMAELDVKKFSQVAQALAGALGGGKVIYIQESGALADRAESMAFINRSESRMATEYYAAQLRQELADEIREGKLRVVDEGQIITIHILQHGSFAAGSASLDPAFLPTAGKIRDALVDIPGRLTVAGHTDSTPIVNGRFISNWELSGARAFSVIHELLKGEVLAPERFVLTGHADTRPRTANGSTAERHRNRRVEIIIDQRSHAGEEQASYEFLRRNLSSELMRGNVEVQSSR
ncbi:MAG: type VI secretion system protein TssL [Desulfobulbaceae bacterium]|nr:MAG: type VI secretion system protein TssL [Desulfobulbaceae bacterium]